MGSHRVFDVADRCQLERGLSLFVWKVNFPFGNKERHFTQNVDHSEGAPRCPDVENDREVRQSEHDSLTLVGWLAR